MKKTPVSIAVLIGLCVGFAHQPMAYEDEEVYMNWSYATGETKPSPSTTKQTSSLNNIQTITVDETFASSPKSYTPTYQIVNQTQSGGTVYGTSTQSSKTYNSSSSGTYNTASTTDYDVQVGDYFGDVVGFGDSKTSTASAATVAATTPNTRSTNYMPSYSYQTAASCSNNTQSCQGNAYGFAPGTSLDIMTTGRGQIEVGAMNGGVQYVNTPVKVQYPVTKQYPVTIQYPVTVQRDVTIQRPVVMQQPIVVQRPVVMQQPVMVKQEPIMVQQQPIYMQQQPTIIQRQPMVIGGSVPVCNEQGC